ncbi:MAG: hypothetical protein II349_03060 [Akkermansia sp.]|nr:hypothetical protein [Akkermansia sp.]
MKKFFLSLLPVLLFTISLITCAYPYGSVSGDIVHEAIHARTMAVTPCVPGWLLDLNEIKPLSDGEMSQVRTILHRAQIKQVHEKYYRDDETNQPTAENIFYLYASNGQCLGGKVEGTQIIMDDLELTQEDSSLLYAVLRPHLQNLFPQLP